MADDWKEKYEAAVADHQRILNEVGTARAKEVADLKAEHDKAFAVFFEEYRKKIEALGGEHEANVAAKLAQQATEFAAKHQAEIKELKERHLLPVVRDKHARIRADLEQAERDEIARLMG